MRSGTGEDRGWLGTLAIAGIALAAAFVLARGAGDVSAAEPAKMVPAPAVDAAGSTATSETAVIAGGCFWGIQGVYQHLKGVTNAVSGYAGGDERTADYERVSTGSTGHAESVRITFDPRQVTYGRLLQVFFSVAHDPTEKNRQGPDEGTQYRSAIFPQNEEQARIAKAYVAQLDQAKVFRKPIATTIETGRRFFQAEAYHQDYLTTHPREPYIVYNDLPKIADLKRLYPDVYLEQPVLVRARR
jgi:peptide-methionine (S)-S-oxide reductase